VSHTPPHALPRMSEAAYHALFESTDEGVCFLERLPTRADGRRDYRYLAMNRAVRAMFGVEDLTGQSTRDCFPDEAEAWYDDLDRVLATGEAVRFERASESRGMVLSVFVARVEDGTGERLLAVTRDVTARRRAEQRQAFLLTLSDALRPPADPHAVQAEACRLLGEHLGADRAYYVEVNEGDGTARVRRHYLRGDSPSLAGDHRVADFGWVIPPMRRGEQLVVADVATCPLVPDADRPAMAAVRIAAHVNAPLVKHGRLVGALCVTDDRPREWTPGEAELVRQTAERIWAAVERAKAEADLRASEEKYRAVFESLDEGVSLIEVVLDDTGRAVDYRFIENNPAVERMTGVGDSAGKTVLELFPDIDRGLIETAGRVARTGRPVRFEHAVPALDRWFEVHEARVGGDDSRTVVAVFADVTARKQWEAEVADARARFERIAATTPGLLYLFDLTEGRNVYVNDGVRRVLGYTPDQVAAFGTDFLPALIHPDDLPEVAAGNRRYDTLADGAVNEHEYRMRHADGGWRLIRSRDTVFTRTPDGRARLVLGLAEDVTARRAAEGELRHSRAFHELVAGLGSDWWFTARIEADGSAVTEAVSDGFTRLLGYTPDELMAAGGWGVIVHPDDRAEAGRQMARLLAGETIEGELRHVAKDGRVTWSQYRTRPEADASGRVVRVYGVARDVSAGKRTEEALRASELRLRAVADHLPNAAVFVIDPDLRYVLAGGQALARAGFTSGDLEGKTVRQVLPPAPADEYEANYRRALAGGSFEVEHAAHGRWYITHGGPLRDADGRVSAALAVSYDITDRVRAEQELAGIRDQLEVRVAERTAELATAVNALETEATRRRGLARQLATAQEAERRRVARDLHDTLGQLEAGLGLKLAAARRVPSLPAEADARLVELQHLLDELTRETHTLAVRLRPTVLDDLGLEPALRQLVTDLFTRSGLAADYQTAGLEGRLPAEVETVIYRVVQEALTNVTRHANSSRVGVAVVRTNGEVTATVEDDGVGFDPAATGSGRLGLLGMRERVELADGRLEVESGPCGTTVYVRIPLKEIAHEQLADRSGG
jgi:PAS domain S-box-containing protein